VEVLWVGASYLLGLGASRLGLPPLVGYLVAGFVLGGFGVRSSEALAHIAHLGILLLLFSVGLKLRLGDLVRKEVLGVGGLHLLLTGLGLTLLFLLVGQSLGGGLLLAIGLAFSSTVLAIKILEDKRELSAFHGRIAVGILVLQDLVAVILLTTAGVKNPSLWIFLLLALPLLRPLFLWVLGKSGHGELLLLFGLGLALGGGVLAEGAGISPELGALLAGALLAGHPQTTELSRTLWGLKEVFLVAFFLEFGLLGIPNLTHLFWVIGLLLLLPLQALLFFWLFLFFKLRVRTAFIGALALASYSEFGLITTAAAIEGGLLESSWASLIALLVAASLAVAAPLNRRSHQLYARLEPWLLRFENRGPHPDREPTSLGLSDWLIVGMGRTGGSAYTLFEARGERVTGLDSDPVKLEAHRSKGRRVFYGDAEDPELWENLDLKGLKGILLTMPELEAKLEAVRGLKARGFAGIIATTGYHPEEGSMLQEAGATLIFQPFAEAGERMAERVLEA
jgi:glutathione-regulated potassium-efflux system ancillary protein KefC